MAISSHELMRSFHQQIKFERCYHNTGDYESGMGWTICLGDYHQNPFPPNPEQLSNKTPSSPETLSGWEVIFASIINQGLQKVPDAPLVCLDFGGGAGLSWYKLALHFRQEILQGKLRLIVTNLEHNYKPLMAITNQITNFQLSSLPYLESLHTLVSDAVNNHLVTYVEGGLRALPKQAIPLRTHKLTTLTGPLPLAGHCHLIHSRFSLTDSQIPEFDYPRLIDLLSPQGICILADTPTKRKLQSRWQEAAAYSTDWFSLTHITNVEGGPHYECLIPGTVLKREDCQLVFDA